MEFDEYNSYWLASLQLDVDIGNTIMEIEIRTLTAIIGRQLYVISVVYRSLQPTIVSLV